LRQLAGATRIPSPASSDVTVVAPATLDSSPVVLSSNPPSPPSVLSLSDSSTPRRTSPPGLATIAEEPAPSQPPLAALTPTSVDDGEGGQQTSEAEQPSQGANSVDPFGDTNSQSSLDELYETIFVQKRAPLQQQCPSKVNALTGNKRALQQGFDRQARRTLGHVLGEKAIKFGVDGPTASQCLGASFQHQQLDDLTIDSLFPASSAPDARLSQQFTAEEVAQTLVGRNDTAPGPDRCKYSRLRQLDPEGRVLASLFNCCLRNGLVPSIWRQASVVMIPKKPKEFLEGDQLKFSKFRPITLTCCAYKILASVILRRLTPVCLQQGGISHFQRALFGRRGCIEATQLLRLAEDHAAAANRRLSGLFVDLTNAFNSVQHRLIFQSLRSLGVPPALLAVIEAAYCDNTLSIINAECPVSAPMLSGVKQGCPLSPLLFCLALNPVLEAVHRERGSDSDACVGYMDDLERLLGVLGLRINPAKCGCFGVDGQFRLQTGEPVPAVTSGSPYKYLGMRYAPDVSPELEPAFQSLFEAIDLVVESDLRPDQKVRAVKQHLLPRVDWLLAAEKPDWAFLERTQGGKVCAERRLRSRLKSLFHLPTTACDAWLYTPGRFSGAGFRSFAAKACVGKLSNFLRLVSVKDLLFANTLQALCASSTEELASYLNAHNTPTSHSRGSLLRELRDCTRKYGNLAQVVPRWCTHNGRLALELLNVVDSSVITRVDSGTSSSPFRTLISFIDSRHFHSLKSAPNQGRYFSSLSCSPLSAVANRNLSFCDWRFIHRARLCLTPTNSRNPAAEKACRRCSHPLESLSHVLNNCKAHSDRWRKKHAGVVNKVVEVVRSTLPSAEVIVEGRTEGSPLIPDIIVRDKARRRAAVVEVKCPIDTVDRASTLHTEMRKKYAEIKSLIQREGLQTQVFTVQIGSLGSCPNSNRSLFKWLGTATRTYNAVCRALIRQTIHHSRNTWIEHCSKTKLAF